MPRIASGLVLYQLIDGALHVLLVHPGGPYQKKDDTGKWSIPKGEVDHDEALQECAAREFREETGHAVPAGTAMIELGKIKQAGGKIVHAWAFTAPWFPEKFTSNTFTMEWPPKSGKQATFPEADRAELMPLPLARQKIKETQIPLLDRLAKALGLEEE